MAPSRFAHRTVFHMSLPVFASAMVILFIAGCGNSTNKKVTERISSVLEIHESVTAAEAVFLDELQALNTRRNDTLDPLQDLDQAGAKVSQAYVTYVGELDTLLNKALSLANRETCPSVGALSEYIVGMKELAEVRYSEMVRLSSLPVDQYTETEEQAYDELIQAANSQREMNETLFRDNLDRFASEHGVEIRQVTAG